MAGEETFASDLDLSRCDEEPIHIPGAIQPHGFLIAVREPDLIIMQLSGNVPDLLGRGADALLDHPLADVLGVAQAEAVQQALGARFVNELTPLRLELAGRVFDASLHRSQGLAVLELEPSVSHPADTATLLGHAIQRLQAGKSIESIKEAAVEEVRAMTGFDRVMLYRFDADGHGEVWAEAKAKELDSYLGLHYPASDIPRQARELYRLNWLRIIPDAGYRPVPLIPETRPDTGGPLDLSFSVLRSVSPVHREYMQNMGLLASMSISLMQGNVLWGLISCGHRTPRFIPRAVRTACETIGRLLSLQINAFEELEERQLREAKSSVVAGLADSMRSSSTSVLLGLTVRPTELLALTSASGAAILADDELVTVGDCPTQAEVRMLHQWVQERMPLEGLLHTFQLGSEFPPAAAYARRASGLLAISLPKPGNNAVLWFRPEEVQTVDWGGNPNKAAEVDPQAGGLRLHPRRSFELWKEVVRGRARRWRQGEVHAASDLRRFAIEIDLARQVLREREAVRARDDLVAVVSHDIRNPMTSVALQATIMKRVLAADTSESSLQFRASVERISSAVDRMNSLLQDLLDLSHIEAGRFRVARKPQKALLLLEEACALLAPLAESKLISLSFDVEPDLSVQADAERLFQVLSNVIGNAIKFTPEQGRIEVAARRTNGFAEFSVRDTGAGISEEQLPHLFERYWQAHEGHAEGSGLGLYIARGIVEAHGGEIWATSVPGEGSSFLFTIPIAVTRD
jgi:two-component system, chemotaxis family, sensor kinase Cph1